MTVGLCSIAAVWAISLLVSGAILAVSDNEETVAEHLPALVLFGPVLSVFLVGAMLIQLPRIIINWVRA